MERIMHKTSALMTFILTLFVNSTIAAQWTDTTPHTIHYVEMDDGIKLEVVDWGGKGEPFVFLAGLALNAHTYDPIIHSFIDSYRVIGITRVGHGNSDSRTKNFTTARLAKDIIGVLDAMNIESAIFAGHSFAGGELNHLGRHYSDRAKGLIYIDAVQDLDYFESHLAVCPDLGYAMVDVLQFQDNFYNTQRVKTEDGSYLPYVDMSVLGKFFAEEEDRHYSGIVPPAIAISHVPEQTPDFFLGMAMPSQQCIEQLNKLTYLGIASFIKDKQNGDVAAIQNSQHAIHMATPEKLVMIMKNWLNRTFPASK